MDKQQKKKLEQGYFILWTQQVKLWQEESTRGMKQRDSTTEVGNDYINVRINHCSLSQAIYNSDGT